jgi:hypothetical protein
MAYFAELDENNVVVRVITISNDVCGEPTLEFPDTEAAGRAFIANTLKLGGTWKQTSYNTYRDYSYTYDDSEPPQVLSVEYLGSKHRTGGTPFRGQYAGIGDRYDAELDEFITPVSEVEE